MAIKEISEEESALQNKVDRLIAVVYAMGAALVIAFAILVFGFHQNNQSIKAAHRVLCIQKDQAVENVREGKRFLLEHPNGTADFSKGFILSSIKRSEVTLAAFKDVSCS